MFYLADCFDISSLIISIASFLAAFITLIVTSITLKWFMNDRKNQDDKEFSDLIYKNIKDISVYKLDIVESNSLGRYTKMTRIEEAERNIVLGQSFLDLYGKIKKLPYLIEFSELDKDSERAEFSFMYNFFEVNFKYHTYRKRQGRKPYTADPTLDAYYRIFSRYLELASKYSLSVLSLKECDDENEQVKEYYKELASIVDESVKKGLL